MYQKILVPLDGSKTSETILPNVVKLARESNAEVVLFTVESPRPATGLAAPTWHDLGNGLATLEKPDTSMKANLENSANALAETGIKATAAIAAGDAAAEQHQPHLEIDPHAPPVGEHPGNRGGDDLVGLGGHGDRRGHADEDQQRGHQKSAADPEDAREESDRAAKPEQDKGVDRHLGDGKIDLQDTCVCGPYPKTTRPPASGQHPWPTYARAGGGQSYFRRMLVISLSWVRARSR